MRLTSIPADAELGMQMHACPSSDPYASSSALAPFRFRVNRWLLAVSGLSPSGRLDACRLRDALTMDGAEVPDNPRDGRR